MDYDNIFKKSNKLMEVSRDIVFKYDLKKLTNDIKNGNMSIFDESIIEAFKERFKAFYNAGYLAMASGNLNKFNYLKEEVNNFYDAFYDRTIEETKTIKYIQTLGNCEQKLERYEKRLSGVNKLKNNCFDSFKNGREKAIKDEKIFQEFFCK